MAPFSGHGQAHFLLLPTMSTPVETLFVLSDRSLDKKLIGEFQSIAALMHLDTTLKKVSLDSGARTNEALKQKLAHD
ncbi:hypothetical protein B0H11DRAFT_2226024 [Mycena galericulata]|nr:hypothetical protein B0H11DRAFT_2226024 [Mycena galericulata]